MRGSALIAARRLRNFCPKRAQEGRKTVQWTVFRWGFSPVGSVGASAFGRGVHRTPAFSPAGSVGAFASLTQRSPPATRTPRRGVPHNLIPFVHIAKWHILFLQAKQPQKCGCFSMASGEGEPKPAKGAVRALFRPRQSAGKPSVFKKPARGCANRRDP